MVIKFGDYPFKYSIAPVHKLSKDRLANVGVSRYTIDVTEDFCFSVSPTENRHDL